MAVVSEPVSAVVLVVEDEPLVRMLAHDTLVVGGYDVVEAVNADEALTLLEARPETRVMFTDVNMPGDINGYGLAQLAAKRWPELSIIVTSGGGDGPGKGDMPAGAVFVEKPYTPSAILDLVDRMVADKAKPRK